MTDVVTGAYSYTGRFIAERLLAAGRDVRTLSRSARTPADPDVPAEPLQFDDHAALAGACTAWRPSTTRTGSDSRMAG